MMRAPRVLCGVLCIAALGSSARAQNPEPAGLLAGQLAERGPRFLLATDSKRVPLDAARTAALQRRLTLDLDGVTTREAVKIIAREANLEIAFSDQLLPAAGRVRLQARGITVAAALTDVLLNADVDVVFTRAGSAVLVKRVQGEVMAADGVVTGRATDSTTREGVGGVTIAVEGTRLSATTAADGGYAIRGVPAGNRSITARRLGFVRQSRAVTVTDNEPAIVDFVLVQAPTTLTDVVTTVTGDQRRVELGHVVGRINADSLVKEAPVSSLSELLTARVPGLQVFQSQGTVGGAVHLQIRGANSLNLNTEPIVIVDGVRYTSALGAITYSFGEEATSRLNDLNPNDIETVEVVKGPSAATLYGTDAANGVLVITTKRGRAGPARWNAYGKADQSAIPRQQYPDIYWGWSGAVFGDSSLAATYSCSLAWMAAGYCTQDSVTVLPNPLNDPQLTLFGSKPRWEYGANVAGGGQALRYYFSGDFEDATGPVQMPLAVAERLKQQRGLSELPEEWRNPNALTRLNLRANVTAMLGEKADLRVNSGYVHSATRSLAAGAGSPYSAGAFTGGPTSPYGTAYGAAADPAERFLQTSTDRTDRFLGSASAQWRPVPWLATRATVGLDLTSSNGYSLARRGDAPTSFTANGFVMDIRMRQLATTADLGATATARRGRLSVRTAVGAQYVRTLSDALSTSGYDLPPGGTSVGEAVLVSSRQAYAETVTLGSYLEQTLGLNDRLFLTGALRVDGASAFGQDYDAAAYPKVGASWLLSEEPFLPGVPGLEELRLRYAYGASGQQAYSSMVRPYLYAGRAVENGVAIPFIDIFALGNPALRPERVREHEFGLDATALGNRLRLGLSWYRRRTMDQIANVAMPPGLGGTYTNLGLTTQRGFEAELTARVVDTRLLSWDLTVQHGVHRTKLVDIGDALAYRSSAGGYAEGYPLGARFQQPLVGYADANGDGIISFGEIQLGDTAVYLGESTPPRSQTLTTLLGLFERRLRLSALLERRTGFTQVNALYATQCSTGSCWAAVDPSTSLADQAQAWYANLTGGAPEPGDFTRLREVTAALDLPLSVARSLRMRSAALALSVRNLALWTAFSGPDPESAAVGGAISAAGGVAQGIPQGRSWALRLDLGL